MKIILSPAKKMQVNTDVLQCTQPMFVDKAQCIIDVLSTMSVRQLQQLMRCNSDIATLNYNRYQCMDISRAMTPAILSYDGIQYKYMAPMVFENSYFDYVQDNVIILSALYGALRPLDAVVPYRLEMQSLLKVGNCDNMYQYWGDSIYNATLSSQDIIIDLASTEYCKAVKKYIRADQQYIKVIFGQLIGDKVVEKGVYVKMARGEMVRYMAENNVTSATQLVDFDRLGYRYSIDHSTDNKYVFIKGEQQC